MLKLIKRSRSGDTLCAEPTWSFRARVSSLSFNTTQIILALINDSGERYTTKLKNFGLNLFFIKASLQKSFFICASE